VTELHCPVCRSGNCTRLRMVAVREAALHYQADTGSARFAELSARIEALWGQDHAWFAQCGECGFGFADPYVAGDAEFYALAYERASYPADKWDFNRALQALRDHRMAPARVLEIGAGFGFFLDRLCGELDARPEIVATEYGKPALEALRGRGYDARASDVRALGAVAPFDLVCGFQVLEHMDDIGGLARTLGALVKPGGLAMFAVPNPARLDFNHANGSMLDMPPNHIGRWTRTAFDAFARAAGMELVEFDTEPSTLGSVVAMDIPYSYLRRAQSEGSLAHWSRLQRSRRLGKAIGAMVAAAGIPRRLPVWAKALGRNDLGGSVLAVLRRPAQMAAAA
jgi:SAM-dependent methyltransferase